MRSQSFDNGLQVRFYCLGCNMNHAVPKDKWSFNEDYERPTLSPSLLVTMEWGALR